VSSKEKPPEILIGALLRVPAQEVHRRIIAGLNEAGFEELRLPHIAVFQYPGPEGCRPGELAERAGMSKQAMNQLLQSLEELGYIRRNDDAGDRRARVVRFTKRGRAAWDKIYEILIQVETEWRAALGDRHFEQLKRLLLEVWECGLFSKPQDKDQ
jgi:DNA-binding MarR family transcriptional regulator